MAPKPKADTTAVTVRFNKTNPVQGNVYGRLERLAEKNPDAQGVGSLITQICCTFIDAAEQHPSLNAEVAQFVASHMDEFMAWMAQRDGNGAARPKPAPRSQPSKPSDGDEIQLDLSKL